MIHYDAKNAIDVQNIRHVIHSVRYSAMHECTYSEVRMASPFSPDQSVFTCQRCGSPLFPQETRCRTCGYVQNFSQQSMSRGQSEFQNPSSYSAPSTTQGPFSPQQNNSEQKQYKGLLGRYAGGASPAQDTNSANQEWQTQQQFGASTSPFAQSPQAPSSFQYGRQEPREPFSSSVPQRPLTPAPFSQRGADNPWQAQSLVEQQQNNVPFAQQAQPSWGQSQQHQPVTPRKQRPRTGMIVAIVLVVVALIGGSTVGYLYLKKHTAIGSTTNASPTHSVAATPTTPPLFSDTFADNSHQWNLQSYPGQFSVSIQNSALTMESDNNKLLWEVVPGNQTYGNFQLSVDAVLSKGSQDNGYGVYFRSGLDQTGALVTYYRFELYGDGTFALFKSGTDANAAPTRLVDYTATSALKKQGTVNHITILARGQTLQLSVNGFVLSTVTDASYTSGSIALFVSNLQNAPAGAQAQFSHLAIYPA